MPTETAPPLEKEPDPVADDLESFRAEVAAWEKSFPADESDRRLLEDLVRANRAGTTNYRRELAHLHALAVRAEACWDADRRAEAEALAAGLSRAPARTAAELRRTRHGALLMIDRWEALAAAMFENGMWSPAQHRLALDLLGTPREFRDVRSPLDPPSAGPSETAAFRIAFARDQIATLKADIEYGLELVDETDRELAALKLTAPKCPVYRALMRDAARCGRQKAWAWSRFFRNRKAAPATSPAPAQTAPSPPPPVKAPARPAPISTPPPIPSPPTPTMQAAPRLQPAPSRPLENRQARRARLADERRRSA